MIIAVTYENGEVFQHFGHTEVFKFYTVDGGKVLSQELVQPTVSGHDAMAAFLKEAEVDVLICGGMGEGAQQALTAAGIEVCSGVKGDTDVAVTDYLTGVLESEGVNCDHHDEEGGCGGGCGSCGGGCGGCGGGCGGGFTPDFDGPNVGRTCKTHYRGTLDDGTQFDASYDRGEPLEFVCGAGMMIHGFDAAVANMQVGEIVNVHLTPDEAYGYPDERAIFTIEIAQLPGSEGLSVGEQVVLYGAMGQPMQVKVTAKDDTNITFDANHELAGKALNFQIELVEVL